MWCDERESVTVFVYGSFWYDDEPQIRACMVTPDPI